MHHVQLSLYKTEQPEMPAIQWLEWKNLVAKRQMGMTYFAVERGGLKAYKELCFWLSSIPKTVIGPSKLLVQFFFVCFQSFTEARLLASI